MVHVLALSSLFALSMLCTFSYTMQHANMHVCVLFQDHAELEAEIERLRNNLKPKVAALHKLEGRYHAHVHSCMTGYIHYCILTGRAEAKGFDLKGLAADEVTVVESKTK